MTATNRTSIKQWTSVRVNSLAVACLFVGIAGGWFIRSSQSSAITGSGIAASVSAQQKIAGSTATTTPARMKEMADAQAVPVLEELKSDPNNPDLLASVGNLYYDAQAYPIAVDYYGRALKSKPADAAVRTDMATAYWYIGNVDEAITEFNKALIYEPNKPNTLFNLGLVKWRGKQ